jgi:hypothetical protein
MLSFSQISMAQAPVNLSVSVGGGLLLPQSSNLRGDMYSAYDYPLSKTGYDLGGKIRLGLPLSPLAFIGTVSYNSLSDNEVIPVALESGGSVNSRYKTALSIVSAGLGVEYPLLPIPVFKPYIGADATMNFISGSTKYQFDTSPETKLNSTGPTSRFGLNLDVGTLIEIPFLPFSLDLEAKYQFANLLGKTNKNNALPGFIVPLIFQSNLDDAKNPYDPKDHDRSINYFTFGLGFKFNIL